MVDLNADRDTDRDASQDSASLSIRSSDPLLCEVSWEACQQVGGIYTVIRSKAPAMTKIWGRRYCVVGPYNPQTSPAEFEESALSGPFGQAVKVLQEAGLDVRYGHWLITGRPRAVLLNPYSVFNKLGEIKYLMWEHHGIGFDAADDLMNQVLAFGWLVQEFFKVLVSQQNGQRSVVGHFHEWMGGSAIPEIRRDGIPLATVFTTHATLLGRYIAMVDPWLYDHLPFINWEGEAKRFNIEAQVRLERAAAHGAHVFTTVSDITALECEHLVGRKPEVILPNGLNIERFVALHEFQNLHRMYKAKITEFVMGHFFPSYTFDLDQTLYFFTSGRYEYSNKGFDLTIEALARLNHRLKEVGSTQTVIFFLVSRQPFRSINAEALNRRAVMEELRKNCEAVKSQIGERLFGALATGQLPRLDDLLDDYWRLRLRRTMLAWKTKRLPSIVTHDLYDDGRNEVLNALRRCNLINLREDPVKVVYHPDFITSSAPLFGMDYDHFARGCHLGVFPSQYEPWGYAPLECVALGLPAITSDLSGFGTYVMKHMPDHEGRGVMVVKRRQGSFDQSANELTDMMFNFLSLDRRGRIALRNRVESSSEHFDWSNLGRYYTEAHEKALAARAAATVKSSRRFS
jgi:glycogen(starch) synthase